jgi:hypothetical protein
LPPETNAGSRILKAYLQYAERIENNFGTNGANSNVIQNENVDSFDSKFEMDVCD